LVSANALRRETNPSLGFPPERIVIAALEERMGLGPPVIELYRQLKLQGALEGIAEVMELGSQDFWCPQKNLVTALLKAFGKKVEDPALLNTSNASQKPARLLYEALGIKYGCVDVDSRVGSVVMDLNFDSAGCSQGTLWPSHESRHL
jgi:hypothetical protein